MDFSDNLYLHVFNLLPELGPARLFRVGEYFGSYKQAFEASPSRLTAAGIETETVEKFSILKKRVSLEAEAALLEKNKIGLLSYKEPAYPQLLLETARFPALLYVKGVLAASDELCIAVVGTRKISTYGRSVTPALVEALCLAGISIVSGLAYGVDALAHQTAVKAGGRTIAVLGGGLDSKSLYPQNHALLAEEILSAGGALLSEYPPGTPCLRHHFVSRNRIISGLSAGTLIVECDLDSGSLITAHHALEQNRTVYAVPGPIYAEASRGPNNLIKMGAKLVTEAKDILDDLNLETKEVVHENQNLFGNSPAETLMLKTLKREPVAIDELIKLSGLSPSEATSALTFLEMKGKIRNLGGQQYALTR